MRGRPLSSAAPAPSPGHPGSTAVMRAIADGLTSQSLDILGQEWTGDHVLKVTNVWGALCEVTVGANGLITWEYRPVRDSAADPAQVAAMVASLLGAAPGQAGDGPPGRCRYSGLTLKGAAGLALRELGLRARLGPVLRSETYLEVHAEVEVTNPGRPEQGRTWISDDGAVRWECSCPDLAPSVPGLTLAQVVGAIAGSLPAVPSPVGARLTVASPVGARLTGAAAPGS